jgi:membrane-bound lytic murein transglycosylase D
MGMGRNPVRRKILTALACAVLAVLPASAEDSGPKPAGRVTPAAALAVSAVCLQMPDGQPGPTEGAVSVPGSSDDPGDPPGPLPPLQGHCGPEIHCMAVADEPVVESFAANFLEKKREWLSGVLERIPMYRGVIASRIEALGLPKELLYLPAVESGFRSGAVSPRGAAGLWQLMRNTAAPYGLTMDQWVDERRDLWKATEASLCKLADDYRAFGDWYLALAAYNCGASRLARIIRESGESDFWALRRKGRLPRETASFVPQFLALARILEYPGRYGLEQGWNGAVAWRRIPVERSVDLRILSRESGVPFDVLCGGNRELVMGITPPASRGYMLKVPEEYHDAVQAALGGGSIPMIDFIVHSVRPGDTLSEIAQAYGVTVEMILEFNPAVRPLALRIGSRILIPDKRKSG